MKLKMITSGVLAAALSCLTASACTVKVRVSCPNDKPVQNVWVCVNGSPTGCQWTDDLGIATFDVPALGDYSVCVAKDSLPAGAILNPPCKKFTVSEPDIVTVVDVILGGSFCSTPPPQGACWLTGGGTFGDGRTPDYSFGGVVYPGCSPKAAEGGNWNVVDHLHGLHFQGQAIIVDGCSGVPTSSPRVNVNIIDYHGTGIIGGISGNPADTIPVTFVARAVDVHDGGKDADLLYLKVTAGATTVLQIGNTALDPAILNTGNLQIHTSSCAK